jgi:SAM-dependent methyltransferase
MHLLDLIKRRVPPDSWAEGEKIPWHEPAFSARMLNEHLSQDHNAASRRSPIIDQHVNWIHTEVLANKATRILDLGCGPGLYTSRLAKKGHTCVGIDFAPASIAYARLQAEEGGLDCSYIEADIRQAEFESGYGLVMMVHGELNVFRPQETRMILEKARQAISGGGRLVIEVHTLEAVHALGEGSQWHTAESGLFSDRPHLLLKEAYWDAGARVATERYYVVDAKSGEVTRYAASIQGYDEKQYRRLLEGCGFEDIEIHSSLGGEMGARDKNYVVFIAQAPPGVLFP